MLSHHRPLRLLCYACFLLTGCVLLLTFLPSPAIAEETLILTVNGGHLWKARTGT